MSLPKAIIESMHDAENLLMSTRMNLLQALHHPDMEAEGRQRLLEAIDRISLMYAEARIRLLEDLDGSQEQEHNFLEHSQRLSTP